MEREIEHDYKVDLFNRCQREQLREAQLAFYQQHQARGGRVGEQRKPACDEYVTRFGASFDHYMF